MVDWSLAKLREWFLMAREFHDLPAQNIAPEPLSKGPKLPKPSLTIEQIEEDRAAAREKWRLLFVSPAKAPPRSPWQRRTRNDVLSGRVPPLRVANGIVVPASLRINALTLQELWRASLAGAKERLPAMKLHNLAFPMLKSRRCSHERHSARGAVAARTRRMGRRLLVAALSRRALGVA